jgi:nitroreductase
MDELYHSLKVVCEKRKSLRDFANRTVSSEDIEKIKEIAMTAPYTSGRKNWDIMVVNDAVTIQKMADIVKLKSNELRKQLKEDFSEEYQNYADYFVIFEKAPVLFVPLFRLGMGLPYMLKNPDDSIRQWERDSYVKSIAGVALLVVLAAESLGLGSCYMTGPLFAEHDFKKFLNIHDDKYIGAIIPVGYAKT